MKTLVTHDVYNISSRLLDVDRDYKVYFDTSKQQFFVYCKGQLAFVSGKRLDKSTIDKAYSTHVRNAHEILKNITRHNSQLEVKERTDAQNRHMQTFHDLLDYANSKGEDVAFCGANTTKWL